MKIEIEIPDDIWVGQADMICAMEGARQANFLTDCLVAGLVVARLSGGGLRAAQNFQRLLNGEGPEYSKEVMESLKGRQK